MPDYVMLICTLGGSPEPLIESIKQWKPARLVFLPSPETKKDIGEKIIPALEEDGYCIDPGCHEMVVLPNSQNFSGCVTEMRRVLNDMVEKWLNRGEEYVVVVDFTGGTKCMTAALAIVAQRWSCRFSYVGGTERTKDGVGIVVKGRETVLNYPNPWNDLGYLSIEDATVLFDRHDYNSAAMMLEEVRNKATDPTVKRTLTGFKKLAEAYALWDQFQHKKALALLKECRKYSNDLRAALLGKTDQLMENIDSDIAFLEKLSDQAGITKYTIMDLMANAKRRAEEKLYDDAVARLYRVTEALAQAALSERHGIAGTKDVPLEKVPEPLGSKWVDRANDGRITLALQDDYALLYALDDPLGKSFVDLKWHNSEHFPLDIENGKSDSRSPLEARNNSILAHGFSPISGKTFDQLWRGCLMLAELGENDLPTFPKLGTCS